MFDNKPINIRLDGNKPIHISIVQQDGFVFQIDIMQVSITHNYTFILKILNKDKTNSKIISISRTVYKTIQKARQEAYKHLSKYIEQYSDYLDNVYEFIFIDDKENNNYESSSYSFSDNTISSLSKQIKTYNINVELPSEFIKKLVQVIDYNVSLPRCSFNEGKGNILVQNGRTQYLTIADYLKTRLDNINKFVQFINK